MLKRSGNPALRGFCMHQPRQVGVSAQTLCSDKLMHSFQDTEFVRHGRWMIIRPDGRADARRIRRTIRLRARNISQLINEIKLITLNHYSLSVIRYSSSFFICLIDSLRSLQVCYICCEELSAICRHYHPTRRWCAHTDTPLGSV